MAEPGVLRPGPSRSRRCTFSCRDPDGYAVEIYFEEAPRGRAGDITAMVE